MIWIQLTWTDAIFNRITLVSSFCAENQLSGKIPENMPKIIFHQKIHGARRRDGEGAWGGHIHARCGWALPAPGGAATPGTPSVSLCAYKFPLDLKTEGSSIVSRKSSATPPPPETKIRIQKLRSGTLPGRGIWRGSSPSSSPTHLHQPSMFPSSMSV